MKNVIVVTGGGTGIGLGIARCFKDYAVLLCGRRKEKIDSAVELLKKEGIDAHGMACDVSSRDAVETLAEKAKSLGNIICLVNNAAVIEGSAEFMYNINMLGTVYPSEVFYQVMAENGVIINISSIGGHACPMNDGFRDLVKNANSPDFIDRAVELSSEGDMIAYMFTKRFLLEYTKHCSVMYAGKKIRVLSISPGPFTTDMLETAKKGQPMDDTIKMMPVPREGYPTLV